MALIKIRNRIGAMTVGELLDFMDKYTDDYALDITFFEELKTEIKRLNELKRVRKFRQKQKEQKNARHNKKQKTITRL